MGLLLLVTGIFGGLFLFIATIYSVGQVILSEGRERLAHTAAIVATLAVMGALYDRQTDLARVLAVPMLAAALWTFRVEDGWYKIFPVLHQAFALIVLAGLVVL